MKKYLLLGAFMGASLVGAFAATQTFDFTYASPSAVQLSATGIRAPGRIDVAMEINNPSLAGMKIKEITAYLNTVDYVSSPSIWLSSELKTNSENYNVPDILSMDVAAPEWGEYDGEELGVIKASLSTPYVLSTSPLYVGYTLTIDQVVDTGTSYPIIISKVDAPGSYFLHADNSSYYRWSDYSDQGAALIVVTLERETAEYSLGINSVNEAYSLSGKEFEAKVDFCNIGAKPVKNIKYSYTFDESSTVFEGEYAFPVAVQPDIFSSTAAILNFEGVEGEGLHDVHLKITEVDGQPNVGEAAEFTFQERNVAFLPVHRPLVEEYTGLWCGYCPRGFIAMELIDEYYGDDQVSVCYHNKDGMAVTNDYPVNISGYPKATIDRVEQLDPYYGESVADLDNHMGILVNLEAAFKEPAFASIDVEAEIVDDVVNVTSNVVFNMDFEKSPYKIGYVLTCNGLSDPKWGQLNYFSGTTRFDNSPLQIAQEWPDLVYGLVFNDVAVDVSGAKGVDNSLPYEIKALETYTHNFSYDIKDNKLITDPAMLVVNAFIINRDNSRIMNANKYRLIGIGAVEGIELGKEAVSTEYYDLSGRRVNNPSHGLYISRTKMSDGTFVTEKKMIK